MGSGARVVIIARWDDPDSRAITQQDFVIDGRSVIPVFSDEATFRAEIAGSGFEKQGVAVDLAFLASLLRGDEVLLLNPASTRRTLTKADLEAGAL